MFEQLNITRDIPMEKVFHNDMTCSEQAALWGLRCGKCGGGEVIHNQDIIIS